MYKREEKRELICLLLFTCNYVVSVWRGFSSSGCLGWATIFYILYWFLYLARKSPRKAKDNITPANPEKK